MSFAEILEAVDVLPLEERIEMYKLIQKKLVEDKRSYLASEIADSNNELLSGQLEIQSVDEIMDDLMNEL